MIPLQGIRSTSSLYLGFLGFFVNLAIAVDICAQQITLRVTAPNTTLIVGETAQLSVTVLSDDVPSGDVTNDPATRFASLLPEVLTVTSNGLVTAVTPGYAVVLVENDAVDANGAQGWLQLDVRSADDRDGDGLPNDYETENGLDPDDPTDGSQDLDGDNLDNFQEFFHGTDPFADDTDGDSRVDGAEVEAGTDPLASDLAPPLLNEDCVATILNRAVQVDPDGTFAIGNVPVPPGAFRVRVICERENGTDRAQSAFLLGVPNGETVFETIEFGAEDPIPVSLQVTSPASVLTPTANGAQLITTGFLVDGAQIDLTFVDTGTFYLSSNPVIATVSANGFVTAVSSGRVLVTATHEGVIATIGLAVDFGIDGDGDGIADDFERANSTNPGGRNLARLPGTQAVASSFTSGAGPERAIDGDPLTSWFTFEGDAANRGASPFIEVILPEDAGVAQVRLLGNRSRPEGFDFFAGVVQVLDGSGVEIFSSGSLLLPAPSRDLTVPVDLDGVRRVRFTSLADEGMTPGLAEIQLHSRPGGAGLNPNDPSDAALDFDGDGLTNLEEFNRGTSLFLEDTDSDGLGDSEEGALGANPLLPDSDNDGLVDGLELGPTLDTDGDGLVNILDPDSDDDGLPDGIEVRLGLDPLRTDTDLDGIPDGSEDNDGDNLPNGEEILENTDPSNQDTDGDRTLDGDELLRGCNPRVAETTTVVGRVIDEGSVPVPGATVRVVGRAGSVKSNEAGLFTLGESPGCGNLTVLADDLFLGKRRRGASGGVAPVVDGTTDAGDITLSELAGSMFPSRIFPANASPRAVAISDLDADGSPDVVTVGGATDVSVMLGNGDGSLQPARSFSSFSGPFDLEVADLDRDGIPDLVVSNNNQRVSILNGRGDGTFTSQIQVPVGGGPFGLAVGELNGDGALDIVTSNFFSNDVSIVFANPLGGFLPESRLAAGSRPEAVALGDFNGDGATDVVTANNASDDLSLYFGNGFGNFQPERRLFAGDGPSSVASADVNGDGIDDIAVSNRDSDNLSLFLGTSDGSFEPERVLPAGDGPEDVKFADLDDDGDLDLLAANSTAGDVRAYFGSGDGSFQEGDFWPTGALPVALSTGDLDLDGRSDFVTAGTAGVTVVRGKGDGAFETQELLKVTDAPFGPHSVGIVDLNVDGLPDVVSANNGNDVSALLALGNGRFAAPVRRTLGSFARGFGAADFDRDGLPDVATTESGRSRAAVLRGRGDGSFLLNTFPVGTTPEAVALADFNRDGAIDVATVNSQSDNVSVLFGLGNGFFQSQQTLAVGDRPQGIAAADVNGDGAADLVTTHSSSDDLFIRFGDGVGSFPTERQLLTGRSPIGVAAGRLNDDAGLDLAVADLGDGTVSIFLADGTGGFEPRRALSVGTSPAAVALADADGDGNVDIVVSNSVSRDTSVLLGRGDGTFEPEQRFAGGAGTSTAQSMAVFDLTRNGRSDIVFARGVETLGILLNRLSPVDISARGPKVTITSPAPGASFTEGTPFAASAEATGARDVLRVDFLVNGAVVASDTAAPYEAVLTAPLGVPSATLGARVIDLVGDTGVAPDVTLSVTPSPPPDVVITSPAPGFEAIEGTLLPIAVTATDDLGVASVEFLVNGDGVFTDLTAPYELDLRVPQGPGPITLGARATDVAMRVGLAAEVVGSVLPDNPPSVVLASPAAGETLIEGEVFPVAADAADDVSVALVEFLVDGAPVFTDAEAPYGFDFTVPSGVTALRFGARAEDSAGQSTAAEEVTVSVTPDPGTTVVGRVIDTGGEPVGGATVSVFSESSTTAADGTFSIPDVPTVLGDIVVRATATAGGQTLTGSSAPTPPVRGGTTNVGSITVSGGELLFTIDFQTQGAPGTAIEDARESGLRPANVYRSPGSGSNALEISGEALGVVPFSDTSVDGLHLLPDGSVLFTVDFRLDERMSGAPGSALQAAIGSGLEEANLYRSTRDGTNELFLSGAALGIVPFTGTNVDGISLLPDGSVLFTVGAGAVGVPGSALEAAASTGLLEANVYRSTGNGTNELFLSGAELGLVAFSGANADGIAALGDGAILFTTGIEPTGAPGSAVAQEALSGFAESHVYRSTGDGANSLFASGADLGLAQVFEPGSGATDGISLP